MRFTARAEQTFDELKKKLTEHITSLFPVQGKKRTLVLKRVEVRDELDSSDYAAQRQARMRGRNWSVPVYGHFELREGGRVIDKGRAKIAGLPKLTNRGSYIVGGSEYMFPLQKRLRSGVYVHTGENDELRAEFNLAKGRNFKLYIHPKKGYFQLGVDTVRNIPLRVVLHALGVTDAQMRQAWGDDLFRRNVEARGDVNHLKKLYEKLSYGETAPEAESEVVNELRKIFDVTELDPMNTALTLGRKFSGVDGFALLEASKHMQEVAQGDAPEDNRESLIHNKMVDLSDFMVERFRDRKFRFRIERGLRENVDKYDKVSMVIPRDALQRPIDSLMTEADVSRSPTQTNPLGLISDYTQVTVRGEGGIQESNALTRSLRALDPSHLGFLDPAHTPEGENIGTTLHLTTSARKKGDDLVIDVVDLRSRKIVEVDQVTLYNSPVAFPEFVDLKNRRIKKGASKIKITQRGKVRPGRPDEAIYGFLHQAELFDINTNLVPFLSHNNGVRVMTAAKMGVQAKPLAASDPPMVQVKAANPAYGTVEGAVGQAFVPKSPIDGVVTKVTKDAIFVSGKKVSIPNLFPLNNNNFINAKPKVTVGDKVKKGQILADTNYVKNGQLALGKNLLVAYTPYKGLNFQDGVVISENAANKLTSEHLYQMSSPYDSDVIFDKKRFLAYFPSRYMASDHKNLDDNGIIKKGSVVEPGGLLTMSMRKRPDGPESQRMASVSRMLAKEFHDNSMTWDKNVTGIVEDVVQRSKEYIFFIRTKEKMRVGDKLVGRYGNKGVVVAIVGSKKMPKDEKGRTIDLLLNPNGVASRMNLGQIMETTASRIADKTGKPFHADGFGDDNIGAIKKELKKHGLKDHESIYDPVEQEKIPGVLVGHQYIYKLEHQVTKKSSVRGAGPDHPYSHDLEPQKGSKGGGRAVGSMELYGLLAHGALANVDEMYNGKSNYNPEFWRALEEGQPLPPSEPTFSQKRFAGLLRGMGVDLRREGDEVRMVPFLDRDLKELSRGEITDHTVMRGKDLKEIKDGLFDPKKTGGVQGDQWSHIKLPYKLPNPTFEKAIVSLLHLTTVRFRSILSGKEKLGNKTGPKAVEEALKKINVKRRIKEIALVIPRKNGAELNALHRELRYLKTLEREKIKPEEYMIGNVPVIPPQFRPVYILPNGNLNVSDLNFHYQSTMQMNERAKAQKGKASFSSQQGEVADALYSGIKGIMGYDQGLVKREKAHGIASIISGKGGPKRGYVHGHLLKRRQDVSGSSVIVANPDLGMDEAGVPEEMAWNLFKPFLIRELRTMGLTPLQARQAVKDRTGTARRALEIVMDARPVMLNRAPSLHKFSIMSFKPRLVPGHSIEIPPAVVAGFNADFDGDTMGIHVPVTPEAVEEAKKMMPSQNIYKPGTGSLQQKLEHEYILGLFKITRPGKPSSKMFGSPELAIQAMRAKKIAPDALISVRSIGATTPGRCLVMSKMPSKMRDYGLVMTDRSTQEYLVKIDKKVGRKAFKQAVADLSKIGRRWAYLTSSSLLLSDLQAMTKSRNSAYRRADIMADRIRRGGGTEKQKQKKIVDAYHMAAQGLSKSIDLKKNSAGTSNNIMDMMTSGARGNPDQVKQMVASIGVVLDPMNNPLPEPVRGTYAEGLDTAEFFQHMYASRKGMIDKSQSVKGPGALTKQVVVSATRYRVSVRDCGTLEGINEQVSDSSCLDRYLASDVAGVGRRNSVVTSKTLAAARANKITHLKVRSPLTCKAAGGVCVMCYGLDEEGSAPPIGDFVGIKDAQALTEPSTQLALKTFHTGGVMTSKAGLSTTFDKVQRLFAMPKEVKGSAVLSEVSGKVDSIKPTVLGQQEVVVAGKKHKISRGSEVIVKAGQEVRAGDALTDGDPKPQDSLRLRGLQAMQLDLRDQIRKIYGSGNVRIHPKTIEMPVKMLTDTVRVTDPGDHPSLVSGDYGRFSSVASWNKENKGKKVRFSHQLPGSEFLPHKSDDWALRMAHNRLEGMLRDEGPAMGYTSSLRRDHPFAALMTGQGGVPRIGTDEPDS